jgi:MFS family permease
MARFDSSPRCNGAVAIGGRPDMQMVIWGNHIDGGALMGVSTSFLAVSAGRLISGVGAVLINVLMTKMIADWFVGREIVTAMAILVASWPLGLALGLLLFTPVGGEFIIMRLASGTDRGNGAAKR